MTRFTDNLWRDLVNEHGAKLAYADRSKPARVPLLKRPRVLAGSTLALAGAGTALTLGLTAATSTPAFAVTTTSNGTVLVDLNESSSMPQVNAKLTAMGLDEQVNIQMASGPATAKGAVTCTRKPGTSGPTVKILDGKDGTEVVGSGNTGTGTWHLASCWTFKTGDDGPGTGNSGTSYPGTVAVPVGSAGGS